MPRPHPPEFRRRAVELAREKTKPICHLAKDLGISESCLRNWVALADVEEGRRDGVTSVDRAELADLRRKLRVAEMENEILRRAAAYFARENVLTKMIYTFIARRCDDLPVTACCRVMGVSSSGLLYRAQRSTLTDEPTRRNRPYTTGVIRLTAPGSPIPTAVRRGARAL
ncbi:MAG: transposase [Actinomycetota bacterium]|nr:transposase [Actinomycetota bacterium]